MSDTIQQPVDQRTAVPRLASRPTTRSLTARLLEILYRDPTLQHSWKDELSDWILDRHQGGRALNSLALLEYLRTDQPQVLSLLTHNPRVRDEVLVFLLLSRALRCPTAPQV